MLREVVDQKDVGGILSASARASGVDFQCSIDHSDSSVVTRGCQRLRSSRQVSTDFEGSPRALSPMSAICEISSSHAAVCTSGCRFLTLDGILAKHRMILVQAEGGASSIW